MFKIEEIDPVHFRHQTRRSTLIIMGVFIVIGFITARLTIIYLGESFDNHIVLNLLGAFAGLLITFWIINTFFKDAHWMKEAMYAWRLKRHLMAIYNVMERIQGASEQGDVAAIRILRFYQLGTEQMYQLDNNSFELIGLQIQMKDLESKMNKMNIDTVQHEFNIESVEQYRH